ncbi:hypothetical protein NQ315_009220 [Exocentrus adspersus]|uniref:U3 small nucleolar RNA-associated protein 25 homolog n=1 Tax=Exocentrus adspersus TaxID=1586481 RepID=A0AAV8WFN3_9CUCU|nr:hypothetical protein NQ315_009220 [Exocentrus adspersus]
MARRKLKYRDVVGKQKGLSKSKKLDRKKSKPPNKYKAFTKSNKTNNGYKRKRKDVVPREPDKETVKKPKVDILASAESSSDHETDNEDYMGKLRESFGCKNKSSVAIETSESEIDDSGDEVEYETNNVEDAAYETKQDEFVNEGDSEEDSKSSIKASGKTNKSLSDEETDNETDKDMLQEEDDDDSDDETDKITLEEEESDCDNVRDPFVKHVFYELHDNLLESLQNNPVSVNRYTKFWPQLGKLFIQIPICRDISIENNAEFSISEKKSYAPPGEIPLPIDVKSVKPSELYIKTQICKNILKGNKTTDPNSEEIFTPLQAEIFSIINNYQDLYYPQRTFNNAEELRYVYCLHVVNHILKTRLKVIHHNARLSKKDEVPEEFRDQGLIRPKVLIIVPFKEAAYRIINLLTQILLPEDKGNVVNKKRFVDDYTGNELAMPKKNPRPEDYEQLFQGNSSDDFKMGITVTKNSLKLYANFYSADIIIASPLGLRRVIGAEGEQERDYDFLASIELLILDQMEIFFMQNWDHVVHIFNHMHLQPKESHGTDFSRVRTWCLNGWAKYYRQTLIFSSLVAAEINAIFNRKCLNYAGKVQVVNPVEFGSVTQVVVRNEHVFRKFNIQNPTLDLTFFVNKVLPKQRDSSMRQTLIFIPSYFDYVRVRNYFNKESIDFVQICEYTKEGKVARARDMFFHGDAHFMLYTERFHFFNRKRIKGIRHIVFYQLPVFPHFYSELCNLMQEVNMNRKVGSMLYMTITVIYSKNDAHRLSAVVGTEKAARMCQSDRDVYLLVTGD